MAHARQVLEALENQFDLPADAVPPQNSLGREPRRWDRGKNHDELRIDKRLRRGTGAILAGLPADALVSQFDGFLAFADSAQAAHDAVRAGRGGRLS